MESLSGDRYRSREHQVAQKEKQRLFLLASDIMLKAESESSPMRDFVGNEYADANGRLGVWRSLRIDTDDNEKWDPLQSLGVSTIDLMYWPERTLGDGLMRFSDQLNFSATMEDKSYDLFTMKLETAENSFSVSIVNRLEAKDVGIENLEIGRTDADKINLLLLTIDEVLEPGVATP